MTRASVDTAVEPLFAHSGRLWVRVWAATQLTTLVVAGWVVVDQAGGVARFVASALAVRVSVVVALLVVYHVIGLLAHGWILRRPWATLLFVPIGWALILFSLSLRSVFGVLLLGAILQGFIFLRFSWAAAILAVVVVGLASALAIGGRGQPLSVSLTRVGVILATGIMIGTVLLYIHRANQEAAARTRLLRQLDDAQRDLADRAKEAGVQEERQRLARDIHDTLAQGFTSVIKHLEAIELSFGTSGREADAAIQRAVPHLMHAQAVSRTSLAEIRRLVWALRPVELTDAPLGAAIGRIVAQWSHANAVAATCSIDPLPPLQPDAEVIFLRATQESLSNIARHANATNVAVTFGEVDGLILLTLEDDGRGFAHTDAEGVEKMGLSGMRERVRRFDGHVLIESAVGSGTSLTVAMPLSSIAATEVARDSGASQPA